MTPDPEDIGLTERFEVRITPTQLAALKADAQRFGRKPAQSARFAIDFYLSATPPVTVAREQRDPGPIELAPLVGRTRPTLRESLIDGNHPSRKNGSTRTLRWDRGQTTDGRFQVNSEKVRGEPILYYLEEVGNGAYGPPRTSLDIETAFYGRGGTAKVKAAAQAIVDAEAVTVTPASQDGTNG